MIDISKGRYWDLPWSLVSGCTPCSPGCEHCWSAGMTYRFSTVAVDGCPLATNKGFTGQILTHPERLTIPLKRKKPTVYAVWNDWAHAAVPQDFQKAMLHVAMAEPQHTFLALTKRPKNAARFFEDTEINPPVNWWSGITICNQPEADAKLPESLKVPGKKFLSIEPMLGAIDLTNLDGPAKQGGAHGWSCLWDTFLRSRIDAVILGGETGPGARPIDPDWVRSVRDQCAAGGVPFFFKGWGEYMGIDYDSGPGRCGYWRCADDRLHREIKTRPNEGARSIKVGRKNAGRLLDGRTHDDLPWHSKGKESKP